MVAVTATLKVQPGKEQEFIDAYKVLLPHVLAVPGVVTYRLHRAANDPTTFLFYELYETDEALKAHGAIPEFRTFNRTIGPLLDGKAQISMFNAVE